MASTQKKATSNPDQPASGGDALLTRLKLHPDNKTKAAMQRDDEQAAAEIERLCAAIDKAKIQISGGLCYFKAESKHVQLKEAQTTLQGVVPDETL